MILTNAYTSPACTPSRHALLTSTYPFKQGMDHFLLLEGAKACDPLKLKHMPEYFKDDGYQTHAVGKWHLGFCAKECLPTSRGFDTFYGFFSGMVDFYNKTLADGYDWHNQEQVDRSAFGNYATDQITDRAIEIINKHIKINPLFMYLSYNAPHTPLQVPKDIFDLYEDKTFFDDPVADEARKITLAMVTTLDLAIDRVVQSLKQNGLYENTLIVFSSDNGGASFPNNAYDNSPFRGAKGSLFEGGSRVVSFVSGPRLKDRLRCTVHDGLFHTIDWIPTLTHFITGEEFKNDQDYEIDGLDQYDMIFRGRNSKRTEIVYKIDLAFPTIFGQSAIRMDNYKMIWGFEGLFNGIFDGTNPIESPAGEPLGPSPDRTRRELNATNHRQKRETGVAPNGDIYQFQVNVFNPDTSVVINLIGQRNWVPGDINSGQVKLFNLIDDPSESKNLADDPAYADKVLEMKKRILYLVDNEYQPPPADYTTVVPEGLPAANGGDWTWGWCDASEL